MYQLISSELQFSGRRRTLLLHIMALNWKLEVRKRKFGKRATINRGWIEFMDDLGLNVGDKCWFKWIDESYHCFRVEVVRAVPVID